MRSIPAAPLADRPGRFRLVVTLGLALGAGAYASSSTAPGPGTKAPQFAAARLDGGTLTLRSLRGKVVLLNFWALECPPCRIEMPELETIHRRYADRGLRVLGITEMDPDREQVSRFVKEIGVTYPILMDPGARIGAVYGIEAHPTSIVIDARGVVRFVNSGYLRGEEKDIESAVRDALEMDAARARNEAHRGGT